jgi:hypothetical protein
MTLDAAVGSLDVRLLFPRAAAVAENVHGAAVLRAVAALVAVDARGPAVLVRRADHEDIARERHALAKVRVRAGVRRLDVRLLDPRAIHVAEHVHRAAALGAVTGRIAADTRVGARVIRRAHGHERARERHAVAETNPGPGPGGLAARNRRQLLDLWKIFDPDDLAASGCRRGSRQRG